MTYARKNELPMTTMHAQNGAMSNMAYLSYVFIVPDFRMTGICYMETSRMM
jgi:hypothetical protein